MGTWHLAQFNITMPAEPLTSPRLAGFVDALDEINALADVAPGFVWRMQTEDGNATAIRAFDDERLIINLTVWTSIETLGDYVYRSGHVGVLRRRREWMEAPTQANQAMWWVPAGELPTVPEAERRLVHLREHGPTPHAFTFREPFPAPDSPDGAEVEHNADWGCPA